MSRRTLGGTNHHVGNKRYRKMVEDRKIDYVNCKRLDKPLVALGIIREWRGQIPTGRFLKMDEKTGLWNDVGDRKAREKTSQALREKAPQIREELEKDRIARERRERGESTEEEDDEEEEVRIVAWIQIFMLTVYFLTCYQNIERIHRMMIRSNQPDLQMAPIRVQTNQQL